MIISVAIVTGFQREITNKVTGFDAHLKVVSLLEGSDEYNKLIIDRQLLESLRSTKGVKQVQVFAQQPGILEFNKEIQGVAIKGVDSTFNSEFFKTYLQSGRLPHFDSAGSHEMLVSSVIADKLRFTVGKKIRVYFVSRNKPVSPRTYTVTGVYKTGLLTFDSKMVFIALPELQRIKNYGLEVYIQPDTVQNSLKAVAFGGDRNFAFTWSNGWKGAGPHQLSGNETKRISVIVNDGARTIGDTALYDPNDRSTGSGGGSDRYYADGYDVFLDDISLLPKVESEIYEKAGYNLTTINVIGENPEVFNWLDILDVNVYIIIILLAVVAIINMCSALLILILERSNMIGILKALGAADFSIRKIFLYNGVLLISKGLLYGNLIALILLGIQNFFGVVQLPEDQYYISVVPVNFSLVHILALNAATILVSLLVLLLPSMLISRLSPAKTIRFE